MQREQAIEIARQSVLSYPQRSAYGYLPANEVEAANWMPPGWVIDAIISATEASGTGGPVSNETQSIEFNFFQAEHLLGLFGGNTDSRYAVTTDADGKMVAYSPEYPEHGEVELIDSPGADTASKD